jgi:hypothetical protein
MAEITFRPTTFYGTNDKFAKALMTTKKPKLFFLTLVAKLILTISKRHSSEISD